MKDKKLSRTSAIVLAAGMSTRMGTLKQLLPYKNTNILNYILGQLKKSYLDQIILVLGYKHEEIKTLVDLCGVDLIINSNYTDEMLLSLKLGLEKLLLTRER